MQPQEVSALLSDMWKKLDAEEKAKWEAEAASARTASTGADVDADESPKVPCARTHLPSPIRAVCWYTSVRQCLRACNLAHPLCRQWRTLATWPDED